MLSFKKLLDSYDYQFPKELIAQAPTKVRDAAKLLVYDRSTRQIFHDQYSNLAQYLPKDSVLVLNQTKVLPARLEVFKPSGGKARLLFIGQGSKTLKFLSDRKLEIGTVLTIKRDHKIFFNVVAKNEQEYELKPSFPIKHIYAVLNSYGQTPLPPYIKHPKLSGKKLLHEYNTVFAKDLGSVAAPTASLHFTKSLLRKIQSKGITIAYTTLHVNLGTFAPLKEQQWKQKKLHDEWYEITKSTAKILNQAKQNGQQIVAVGTTVVRTLESASDKHGKLAKLSGATNLFITENTTLKFVDSVITNFHVPKSSLLMLVASFVGRKKLLALYKIAIAKKYRLFSFGDGMFLK